MKMLRILAVAALASSATLAMADEKVVTEDGVATFATFKPANIRAEVGTTGYGGAISWSANPYVALTLGYNGGEISWTDDVSINGNKYDLEMDNNNVYLNAEIRPFANWFYVAAGVAYLDNEYDVSRTIAAGNGFSVNGTDYLANTDVKIAGKVSYKESFVPYVGLGISPSITSRVGLFGEIGAYYTGNPDVSLRGTGTGTDSNGNGYQGQLQAEQVDLENKKEFEFMPVAKVGLSVRF